ncbi:14921_t:CDS:2 [Funneliformis geosporum]|uniref:14921_t:CDS:1 n=1 Tax=Funneliformis geosporum TaxID=1117311 RepID=A0A9W4T2Y0_9GLOM|nr:14921_t:CDS:2 [Funneliformis geosporum]
MVRVFSIIKITNVLVRNVLPTNYPLYFQSDYQVLRILEQIEQLLRPTIAIFAFPPLVKRSASTKTPRIKFVWLAEKREIFLINPDSPDDCSYAETKIFQEIKEVNQVIEKTEEILIEKFAQNLDNYYITKEICKEENYNPNCLKSFNKELKSKDPNTFFDNLHKFIYFLVHGRNKDLTEKMHNNRAENSIFCGSEKDILIIAEPETYRFIKQNDTNDFLKNLVGDIICANLENGVKLIMVAK